MMNEIYHEAESRMKKTIEALHHDLNKIRTGRAHPSLLEKLMVSYYGNETPLNQLATISISDSRTLMVTVWDRSAVQAVEKAILTGDLGLNPATAGTSIRVPLPALTEERRKDLIKIVKQTAENSKVSIRTIRRDANTHLKDLLKQKEISEDDERAGQDKMQKLTDKYIAEVDKQVEIKEKDLMEI